jgi:DNA-binding MarR family transcriptional regulator
VIEEASHVVREGSKLEPALAFLRELWALDHALGSTSKRMHDRMGITAQQRMLLRFLGKYRDITAAELAVLLHVEPSTLSLALKRLEERGLISRREHPGDGRKALLSLTRRGRRFDRPAIGTVERAVEETLRATRARDVEVIRSFLQRLVHNLER